MPSTVKRTPQRKPNTSKRRSEERVTERSYPVSAPVSPSARPSRSVTRWQRESSVETKEAGVARESRPNTRRVARSKSTSAVDAAAPTVKTAASPRTRSSCPPAHWGLILVTLLLALGSIPIIYSASQANALDNHGNANYFLTRQIVFVGVGLVSMLLMSRVPIQWMRVLVWGLYGLTVVGLILTKFSPLGVTMGGVERWMKLGPIPLQVSEIAKFALIGVLADFWSRKAAITSKSKWPWYAAFAITGIPMVLVFVQPHFSAAVVLFALPIILAFQAGVPKRQAGYLALFVTVCVVVTVFLSANGKMPLLKPYQQVRIAHLFTGDADGRYQTEQGLRAMARGGVMGVGPGHSLFKQGHLPAPHTDFILAVIGEEAGLVGMLGLLLCYGAMIFFCLQIGHNANTPFELLLCVGVGSLLALQVICNLCVVLDFGPVTGMPLPLISYGGSGLVCTLLGIGWVLGVSRNMVRVENKKGTA